jgi:hypothetical protein
MAANLSCPHCSEPLPVNLFVSGHTGQCPSCYAKVEAYIFPEFHRGPSSPPGIHLADEHEAVCFFHSRYRARTPCDHCGRFLCEICAIDVGSREICPECLSQLRKQKNETGLVHYAALFDNVALFLVTAPLVTVIFWLFTILAAPVSLFLSFYYWSRQWNLLPRSRLHFSMAIFFSVLLIAFWAFVIYHVATVRK